jgi:hypothetical protein
VGGETEIGILGQREHSTVHPVWERQLRLLIVVRRTKIQSWGTTYAIATNKISSYYY